MKSVFIQASYIAGCFSSALKDLKNFQHNHSDYRIHELIVQFVWWYHPLWWHLMYMCYMNCFWYGKLFVCISLVSFVNYIPICIWKALLEDQSSRDSLDWLQAVTIELIGPLTATVIGRIEFFLADLCPSDCCDELTFYIIMSMTSRQFYN